MQKTVVFPFRYEDIKNKFNGQKTSDCKHEHCVYLKEYIQKLYTYIDDLSNSPTNGSTLAGNDPIWDSVSQQVKKSERKYQLLSKELLGLQLEIDKLLQKNQKLKLENNSLKQRLCPESLPLDSHGSYICSNKVLETDEFSKMFDQQNPKKNNTRSNLKSSWDPDSFYAARTENGKSRKQLHATDKLISTKASDISNILSEDAIEMEYQKEIRKDYEFRMEKLKRDIASLSQDNDKLLQFLKQRNQNQDRRHQQLKRFNQILQDFEM